MSPLCGFELLNNVEENQCEKPDIKSVSLEAKNTFVKNGCEDCCMKVKA
jgi:hypothetical protein